MSFVSEILEQGKFYANGAKNIVNANLRPVPIAVQQNRYAKCLPCANRDKIQNRCKICKCFLTEKVKSPTEHCPIGEW